MERHKDVRRHQNCDWPLGHRDRPITDQVMRVTKSTACKPYAAQNLVTDAAQSSGN